MSNGQKFSEAFFEHKSWLIGPIFFTLGYPTLTLIELFVPKVLKVSNVLLGNPKYSYLGA